MDYKKIIILTFLLVSTVLDIFSFVGGKFDKLNMFHRYYQNDVIVIITIMTIIINLLLISLLIVQVSNKNLFKNSRIHVIFFLTLLLIALIWFEIYYGSTFYYGDIRDKQALWYGANDFGIIGSILLSFSLFNFNFSNLKYRYYFDISIFLFLVIMHFIILNILNEKWRIFFKN